jgi:hypothetical protein
MPLVFTHSCPKTANFRVVKMSCNAAKTKLAFLDKKIGKVYLRFFSMNSKHLDQQCLLKKKTGSPDTIIGSLRRKLRGLMRKGWAVFVLILVLLKLLKYLMFCKIF